MNVPAGPTGAQQASWRATVGTAVALQWLLILILVAIAWIWSGETGAQSLLAGGAAVAIPNAMLALWLTLRMRQSGSLGVVALFTGEVFKLGFTIALLVLIVVHTKPAWIALLVGVIGALKAQWLALWFTRNY